MISTQDNILNECHPQNITWEEFMEDCGKAVNTSEVHSDECSTDDEELAAEERNQNIRPERWAGTNSVIKIYDKVWRSSRVRKVVKFKI